MTFSLWFAAAALFLRFTADEQSVDSLRAGDQEAFRALVLKHHGALVRLADTIVKNRSAAEDVVQETWLAVFANIGKFERKAALSTWIIAILINKAKTAAKREGRYTPLAVEWEEGSDVGGSSGDRFTADGHWINRPIPFDGLSPERIIAGRQLWTHVREMIDRLPPAQRAVLIMRDVEDRSSAETCRLLELSQDNQRVLLHRARTRIRNDIESLLEEP